MPVRRKKKESKSTRGESRVKKPKKGGKNTLYRQINEEAPKRKKRVAKVNSVSPKKASKNASKNKSTTTSKTLTGSGKGAAKTSMSNAKKKPAVRKKAKPTAKVGKSKVVRSFYG
jgi:hypothetical protein